MFDIQFEKSNSDEIDANALEGRLIFGSQMVPFRSSLEFWSPIDYELQWRRGIRTMLEGGERSCLITSITDPATSNFLVWWLIYRDDSEPKSEEATLANHGLTAHSEAQFVFRNQILMIDEVRSEFDLQYLERLVPDREPLIHEVDDSELDQLLASGELRLSSLGSAPVAVDDSRNNLFDAQDDLDDTSTTFREWKITIGSVQTWYESILGR